MQTCSTLEEPQGKSQLDENHHSLLLPSSPKSVNMDQQVTKNESTEQFQIAKVSPMKENGSVMSEGGTKTENMSKGMVCVSVNKNSLKSSTPQQIDSHLVPKNTKADERETML
ncbi:hypothetical protein E2C01_078203 [Portunus trituberculatus]|uniref:Uncharacterized protein n=1 Tax=Portunus trituberculatus TaxID=210409 RepID=A0A5B7IDD2_PORTR|nr:hypothetical protein [Portunus trituberculatus]